jgi:hypothetical protein
MHPLEQRPEEHGIRVNEDYAKNAVDAHVGDVDGGMYQRDWKDEFQSDVVLSKLAVRSVQGDVRNVG